MLFRRHRPAGSPRAVSVCLLRATLAGAVGAALSPNGADAGFRRSLPVPEAPQSLGKPEPQFPLNASWRLIETNGKPAPADAPSFSLDDKFRATGFSGCNTYSMTLYPVHNQRLVAGPIALTRKTCDKAAALFERDFLVDLHSRPTWSVDGGDLLIKGASGTLRFRRGL